MKAAIVAASIIWPLALGAAVWQRVDDHDHPPLWTTGVYLMTSAICHRLPDRSFHTAGVQWPVCGRCSGLYLAAPFGALMALFARRRRIDGGGNARLLLIASVPTIVTIALEWLQIYDVGNVARAISALPIGAAVAFVITGVVDRLARHGSAVATH